MEGGDYREGNRNEKQKGEKGEGESMPTKFLIDIAVVRSTEGRSWASRTSGRPVSLRIPRGLYLSEKEGHS